MKTPSAGSPTRSSSLVRAVVSILGLAGLAVLFLMIRRPDVVSSGTIGFVVGWLTLAGSFLLLVSSLKGGPERKGFSPGPLDFFYAASVAISLLSFFLTSKSRGAYLQPLMMVAAFTIYLLVRTNRQRLGGRAAALAGGFVAVTGLEAVHGLVQWASGSEMRGFLFNVNHFAMFLAVAIPLAIAFFWHERNAFRRTAGLAACGLMLAAVALSRCRTAYTALLFVGGLAILQAISRRLSMTDGPEGRGRMPSVRAALVFGAAGIFVVASLGLSFKQMSVAGRFLIWKVSARMALAHPLAGVGYGNFPAFYNIEQGRYFGAGRGTPLERLSAMAAPYAFNDYLESAVETGIVGLVVLFPFWLFALREAVVQFRRFGGSRPSTFASSPDERLTVGAAGSVMAFMIMAFFYYPGRILPVIVPFSALLGWLAGEDRPASVGNRRAFRAFVLSFGAISFAAAALLMPRLGQEYRSERTWSAAREHVRCNRQGEAVAAARAAYPRLKHNAEFVDFHAGLLLAGGNAREAASVLEGLGETSSNPFLAEKLARARLELGDLEGALESAREAASILPWRLTSKSLLAEICLRMGDRTNAARYARLVIATPMKVRTTEGEALKAKALELLSEEAGEGSQLVELLLTLPRDTRGGVLGALQAMGSRSELFVRALRTASPEERNCLAFLMANMPDRDVRGLPVEYLEENVRTACLARRTLPLAASVPDGIFLDYVLPYAVADERRESWRADFYRRFRDAAAMSPSVEEAVLRLNRDIFLEFRLEFAERDIWKPFLSPGQSIGRGIVSCGEAALLLVDACRSVGIPARMAVLPRWQDIRGGHIWAEIWDRGRWHHITAYDANLIDMGWISSQIASSFRPHSQGVVFTPVFRRTGLKAIAGRDVVFIDISENYLK